MEPMKKKDPAPGRINIVFLPIQPNPALRARARSGTGPESAKVWAIAAPRLRRRSARGSNRARVTLW
jgi:hypothetical protein